MPVAAAPMLPLVLVKVTLKVNVPSASVETLMPVTSCVAEAIVPLPLSDPEPPLVVMV